MKRAQNSWIVSEFQSLTIMTLFLYYVSVQIYNVSNKLKVKGDKDDKIIIYLNLDFMW